ncbi:hypothetical protein [Kangiella shandongensis]|uniref:hypothetical protein n=1 Tax=Kangiella shandongensis TaxID=2763258 RepID=UPI001CBAD344|nr:hypothetical protein [Kangiella shandongensis]
MKTSILFILTLFITACATNAIDDDTKHPIESTWGVSPLEQEYKYKIHNMDDYQKFYIDTVRPLDSDTKDDAIYEALNHGLYNSLEGSDVYVHTLSRLIALESDIDERIKYRKLFLDKYIDYTYIRPQCRWLCAHRELVAGAVFGLSKDMVSIGHRREAADLILNFLDSYHSGIKLWLQLSLLEHYQQWTLEIDITDNDKKFSQSYIDRIKTLSDVKHVKSLKGRYSEAIRLNRLIQAR